MRSWPRSSSGILETSEDSLRRLRGQHFVKIHKQLILAAFHHATYPFIPQDETSTCVFLGTLQGIRCEIDYSVVLRLLTPGRFEPNAQVP